MNTEMLFEGYRTYTDADKLAASSQADEAPATITLSVATVILTVQKGC
jgi:hypothetical protein